MEIAPLFKDLFESAVSSEPEKRDSEASRISINSITNRAGTFYEKIRYLVDYKEEHIIRRSAIERILRRKILIENSAAPGRALVEELIAGSYLPNNELPESIADEINQMIAKYRGLLTLDQKWRASIYHIASAEIELFLFPQALDEAVVEAFYRTMRESVFSPSIERSRLDTQLYIACRRTLLKEDQARLCYSLWLHHFPSWHSTPTEDIVLDQVEEALGGIERALADILSWTIAPKLRNETIYFMVVREIVSKYGVLTERMFDDESLPDLDDFIRSFLKAQYEKITAKARGSGIRAAIYIFCTKTVLAFVIEIPYELYFLQAINHLALGINIIFHPLLLLAMTRTISQPDKKNTEAIIEGVHATVSGAKLPTKTIRPSRRHAGFTFALSLLYLLLFLFTFGVIIRALQVLQFNAVGIALFLLFLTLVSYFGIRIRYNANGWRVRSEESTLGFLWGIFTLPIMRVGRWLSIKFTSINVFVFIMDFIIETPFKLVLRLFDAFITFLKEIREQTY